MLGNTKLYFCSVGYRSRVGEATGSEYAKN